MLLEKKDWSNLMENNVVYPFKRYVTSPFGLSRYECTILCTTQFIDSMINTCTTLFFYFFIFCVCYMDCHFLQLFFARYVLPILVGFELATS